MLNFREFAKGEVRRNTILRGGVNSAEPRPDYPGTPARVLTLCWVLCVVYADTRDHTGPKGLMQRGGAERRREAQQ